MNRIIIFLLLLLSISSNLLAYENEYFRVNNERMTVKEDKDFFEFELDLNKSSDYSCPNEKNPTPPSISVNPSSNNGEHLIYTEDEAYKAGKAYVDRFRNSRYFYNKGYTLGRTSVERFGDHKALYYEVTTNSDDMKVYIIAGEKYKYTIQIKTNKGDNFYNTHAYRCFVSSFVMLNSKPKSQSQSKDTLFSVPDTPKRTNHHSNVIGKKHRNFSDENGSFGEIFGVVTLLLAFIGWRIKRSL